MLVEQAKAVQRQIQKLEKVRENEKRRDEFAQRESMLADLVEDLEPLAKKMKVLSANGIKVDYDGTALQQLVQKVDQVREQFDEDAQWIIQRENDLSDLKRWMLNHQNKIRRKIQSAWMTHYQQRVPELSHDLLDVMGRIEGFQEPVQTIRQCNRRLEKFKDKAPATQERYDAFTTSVEKRTSTWNRLGSEDLSEDVVNFLRDAGKKGARVHQFTETVREWLDENDLLGRIRIQLQS